MSALKKMNFDFDMSVQLELLREIQNDQQVQKDAIAVKYEHMMTEQETQYLLSSPANAQRLLRSLASARNGKLTAHELIEE